MLKTPLPEKLDALPFEVARNYSRDTLKEFYKRDNTLNQLITYLAELTEVVEGKRKRCVCGRLTNSPHSDVVCASYPFCQEKTPTLKEQLLGEVRKKKVFLEFQGEEIIPMKDLEAIINKLIP